MCFAVGACPRVARYQPRSEQKASTRFGNRSRRWHHRAKRLSNSGVLRHKFPMLHPGFPIMNQRYLNTLLVASLAVAACSDDETPADTTPDSGSGTPDGGTDTGLDGSGSDGSGGTDFTDVANPDLTLDIPGLSGPAGAYFDERGVLHVTCATSTDCAAVVGYFHARDRFAQMDLRRRVVTGRLTQLVGDVGYDNALSNRQLYSTREGNPLEDAAVASASPEVRAELEAYARGVNAWLGDLRAGRNGAALADEYNYPIVSSDVIPDWTVEDSIATILALVESLTNNSGEKLSNATLAAAVDADTYADLYGPTVLSETTTYASFDGTFARNKDRFSNPVAIPAWINPSVAPLLDRALNRVLDTRLDRQLRDQDATGSNNWVVAPAQTTGGNTLLANDPHLGLSNPAIWYIADIDASADPVSPAHTSGVTFAGVPWVILGQNGDVAWGATTTYLDQTDVYLETLTEDGSGVIFNGESVPFIRKTLAFEFPDGEVRENEALWVPHHGPVLSIDLEAGTAVSMRWSGHDISTDVNVPYLLARATTVEEVRQALNSSTTLGQNWITIDNSGNIGWFPFNRIPDRTWATEEVPSAMPVPGDGTTEWTEYWPLEELPQAYNPANGFIATANNDMTGALLDGNPYNDGYSPLQISAAPGIRQQRIVDRLFEQAGAHTTDTMSELQSDVYSIAGELAAPAIIALLGDQRASLSAAAVSVVDTLEAWDYRCTTGLDGTDPEDSPPSSDPAEIASANGCFAFTVLLSELRRAQFADEVEAGNVPDYPYMEFTVRQLVSPDTLNDATRGWDDITTVDVVETPAQIAAAAIEATAAYLTDAWGEDPTSWLWGRAHTLTLEADLFAAAGIQVFNNGTYANDGAMWTVDVAQPNGAFDRDFAHTAGASMRFVCEGLPAGVTCTIELPGGQRHFRDDPTYDAFLDDWLNNRPWPLLRGAAAVVDSAIQSVQVRPAP
jgi:penicillin amidase